MASDEVKKSFHLGRLGLRSMVEVNRALQRKWLWRFVKKDGSLCGGYLRQNMKLRKKVDSLG